MSKQSREPSAGPCTGVDMEDDLVSDKFYITDFKGGKITDTAGRCRVSPG